MRRGALAATIVAFAAAALLWGSGAGAEIIQLGKYRLDVGGSFKPKKLSKKKRKPIKLKVHGKLSMTDGSVPPGLSRMRMDFDSDGTIFQKGLPTCKPQQLRNRNTKTAKRVCRKALVGQGKTKAIVDFPDQAPFDAHGPLLAFNGPSKGKKRQTIIFHVYANVPAPTAFVVPGKVTNAPGNVFGKRLDVKVPTIAGGSGHLTEFEVTINRKWRHRGKKRGYVEARCRSGRFVVEGDFRFRDGSKVNGSVVRACRGKR